MTLRALVTFGVGSHEELLGIALPSFQEFAERHDYEVCVADPIQSDRPPSWWKVPILLAALDTYDEALWIDSDIVIVDPSDDIDIRDDAYQAMVEHHTGDGDVPNCAVWYVRQAMRPYLEEVWSKREYIGHGWWEQAALIDVMGYTGRPARMTNPTELYQHTHFLDPGWNVHPWDTVKPDHSRFMHATMMPDRAAVMREWAATAQEMAAA